MKINPALKKFLSYARPYRWWIVGATMCGLLKYNIPVLFPWILKDVIGACRPKWLEVRGEFNPRGGISTQVVAKYPRPGSK